MQADVEGADPTASDSMPEEGRGVVASYLDDYHSTWLGRTLTDYEHRLAAEVLFDFLADDHWSGPSADLVPALGACREIGLLTSAEHRQAVLAYVQVIRLTLIDLAAKLGRMEAARDMLREELTMISEQRARR